MAGRHRNLLVLSSPETNLVSKSLFTKSEPYQSGVVCLFFGFSLPSELRGWFQIISGKLLRRLQSNTHTCPKSAYPLEHSLEIKAHTCCLCLGSLGGRAIALPITPLFGYGRASRSGDGCTEDISLYLQIQKKETCHATPWQAGEGGGGT